MRRIINFFDHLEDWIRAHLSRYPFVYAILVGIGLVFFWRGTWMIADLFEFLTGPVTIIIAIAILGLTGILVTEFLGKEILIKTARKERKLEEKTHEEIIQEEGKIDNIEESIKEIQKDILDIKTRL